MANTVTIDVVAEVRKATAALGDVKTSLGGIEKAAKSSAPMLKGALAADVIVGAARAFGSAVSDAAGTVSLQADLAAQTEAALKSTGGAAGVTADQVTALSEALEGKSKIDAEAITSGQNLLLTFTNVANRAGSGNDIFNRTTQIMADMSTALGQDTTTSAMQLGKALNDPIKGIGALSKVGVTFTDQQKAQVKAMTAAGDTAGAQKVILAELGKEFGGSASASAATFSGTMFALKDTLDGVLEDGFRAIQPALQDMATWMSTNLPPAIDATQSALGRVRDALAPVASAIGSFIGFLKENPAVVQAFAITLGVLAAAVGIVAAAQWVWNAAMTANPIGLIIVAIAALVAAGVYLATRWDEIRAALGRVWGRIKTATLGALTATGAAITSWISRTVTWFSGLPGRAGAALSRFGSTLSGKARDAMTSMKTAITDKWTSIRDWFTGIPARAKSAIGDLGATLDAAGRSIIGGFLGGLRAKWDDVTGFVGGIASWIADHKGPLSYDRVLLRPAGTAIMAGLVAALKASMPDLARQIDQVTATMLTAGSQVIAPTIAPRFATVPTGTFSASAAAYPVAPINVTIQVAPTADRAAIGREVIRTITAYRAQGGRR